MIESVGFPCSLGQSSACPKKRNSDDITFYSSFLGGSRNKRQKTATDTPSSLAAIGAFRSDALGLDEIDSLIAHHERTFHFSSVVLPSLLAKESSLLSLMMKPQALRLPTHQHFQVGPVPSRPFQLRSPPITMNTPDDLSPSTADSKKKSDNIPTCLPVTEDDKANTASSSYEEEEEDKQDTEEETEEALSRVLPPREDGVLQHHSKRQCFPLATEEDLNWLSDFLCFVRSDVIEVFRAGKTDVSGRSNSKKIVLDQIGIRCRFCAHLPQRAKARRSACFPSSTDRIYQSVVMMIRDHFGRCTALDGDARTIFEQKKSEATQGASDSKKYWSSSARKLGMVDSGDKGIIIDDASLRAAATNAENEMESIVARNAEFTTTAPLIRKEDKSSASGYMMLLMDQVERAYLTKEECVGNRRTMEIGYPGFGCRYCNSANRKGLCRFFPARRRTLPLKLKELSDHLMKCPLCPIEVKDGLQKLDISGIGFAVLQEADQHKNFLDQVWKRLHRDA